MLAAIHFLVILQLLSNVWFDFFFCSRIFLWTEVNTDWSVIHWVLFPLAPLFFKMKDTMFALFSSLWYLIYLT